MRRILYLWLALILAGCGSTGEPINKPSELTDIQSPIRADVVWSTSVGIGSDERDIRLAPVIHQNKIYVIDFKGFLAVHDTKTGRQVWTRETGIKVSGGLGVGGDKLFVGSSDAELVALSLTDGAEQWRIPVSSEIQSVPQVSGERVVVQTGDGNLVAVSVADGKGIWVFSRDMPILSLRGTADPVISGQTVIAGFANGKLAALGLHDGRLIWERVISIPRGRSELERMVDIDATPVVDRGEVYVAGYQGNLASLLETTGDRLWNREMSSHRGLAFDSQRLYLVDAQDHLWALNRGNGASFWKQDKLQGRKLSTAAIVDGYLVVGDFEGYLHFLDLNDGTLVARLNIGQSGLSAPPQTAGGLVYVYTKSGTLVAAKLASPEN